MPHARKDQAFLDIRIPYRIIKRQSPAATNGTHMDAAVLVAVADEAIVEDDVPREIGKAGVSAG